MVGCVAAKLNAYYVPHCTDTDTFNGDMGKMEGGGYQVAIRVDGSLIQIRNKGIPGLVKEFTGTFKKKSNLFKFDVI